MLIFLVSQLLTFLELTTLIFNTKLDNVINQLGNNDYLSINTQIEVINAGYQLNEKDYLSVGFYTELDIFSSIPKDFLELLRDGKWSKY